MSRDPDRRDSNGKHRAAPGADEPQPALRALCETILSVLDRDQGLRRNYLRRRWQGLVE